MSSISESPNLHAPPAVLRLLPGAAMVRGYQSFTLRQGGIVPSINDGNLCRKHALLDGVFAPSLLARRSVLDLGANAAYFALMALQRGAASATAVDLDQQYVDLAARAAEHVGVPGLRAVAARVDAWEMPADVVLALALVHWLYGCTADFHSMDAVVSYLARLTRYALVVEWIAPHDAAIRQHGHIPDAARANYTYGAFREALHRRFPRVIDLGFVNATRRLFVAYRTAENIDLSGPMPLLKDAGTLRSSHRLTECAGKPYYSRLYDLGDTVLKQASYDLACREAEFLQRMGPSPLFPRALSSAVCDGYSTLELQKVAGPVLSDAVGVLRSSPGRLRRFMRGALGILDSLRRQGIVHRDIRPDNIIVRDGLPVLLDFGWAVTAQQPYHTPPLLGAPYHAPEGPWCDTYAMGRVLEELAGDAAPAGVRRALALMTASEPALRVHDFAVLSELISAALTAEGADSGDDTGDADAF